MVELVPARRLLSMVIAILMVVMGLYILMVETSMYPTWSITLFPSLGSIWNTEIGRIVCIQKL